MVSFSDKTMGIDGTYTAIDRWEVWFQTPFGLIKSFDEAVSRVVANDLDPNLVIQPVSVAVSSLGYTEVVMR